MGKFDWQKIRHGKTYTFMETNNEFKQKTKFAQIIRTDSYRLDKLELGESVSHWIEGGKCIQVTVSSEIRLAFFLVFAALDDDDRLMKSSIKPELCLISIFCHRLFEMIRMASEESSDPDFNGNHSEYLPNE